MDLRVAIVNIEKFDPIKDNAKVYGLQAIRRILSNGLQRIDQWEAQRTAPEARGGIDRRLFDGRQIGHQVIVLGPVIVVGQTEVDVYIEV